jgi:GTP-binding protein Era
VKPNQHKSGYVAIIGKPNAGKSTLMNRILEQKIAITTHKPQTTRHQILGLYSEEDLQIIFLDTPGIISPKYELQKAMMRFMERARNDADLILFIVDVNDADIPGEVASMLQDIQQPIALIVNKIDQVSKSTSQEVADTLNAVHPFEETCCISALTGGGVTSLMDMVKRQLPAGPAYYPKDIVSEQPVRFFVAELIREQLFLQYYQELPYSCTVNIVQYDERDELDYIHAEIIVNHNSQKGIIIGKGGRAIKELGKAARAAIEDFVDKKVYLDLFVKVREKWRDDPNMVRNLGY